MIRDEICYSCVCFIQNLTRSASIVNPDRMIKELVRYLSQFNPRVRFVIRTCLGRSRVTGNFMI